MSILERKPLLGRIGPPLSFLLYRALWCGMRLEVFGSEHLAQAYREHGQAILAFWHNRMVLLPYIYRYQMRLRRLVIMVSRSRDGEFIANFLERFGFKTMRGSTSKGGIKIFAQAIRMARQGYDVAITPDGPRGPRYQVQPGVIKLAQMTSLPIVPGTYQASIRLEFKHSWDRFILPGPFAKVALEMGPLIRVARDARPRELEEARLKLQERLLALNSSSLARLKQRGKPAWVMAQCTGNRRD